MKCKKIPYGQREAYRIMRERNYSKGRSTGHVYKCTQHRAYHVTKQDRISERLWDLIKVDTQITGG